MFGYGPQAGHQVTAGLERQHKAVCLAAIRSRGGWLEKGPVSEVLTANKWR